MGRPKLIYFSDELYESLQNEKNASRLICDLLAEHYKKTRFEGLNEEQLKTELEILNLKDDMIAKIKELRNGRT